MSELIRQNKPVYAIDTADTETHFKRCGNNSIECIKSYCVLFNTFSIIGYNFSVQIINDYGQLVIKFSPVNSFVGVN